MTDVVAANPVAHSPENPNRAWSRCAASASERSTLPISIATGLSSSPPGGVFPKRALVRISSCRPRAEVFDAAVSFYRDGYANASMAEHVGASLMRILAAAR